MSRTAESKGDLYGSRLSTNLRRLIAHQAAGVVNAWCVRHGLPQSTINKIANGMRDASVSVLEMIEERTGYSPWQLLHPDFDPRVMPPMMDQRTMRVAAIYASITDEKDRARAEAIMEQFAAEEDHGAVAPSSAPPQRM